MSRPRILILTPRYPYPVIGGDRLRIYQICKALSSFADLTLLSLCETQEEINVEAPSDGVFQNIERVFLPRWQSKLQAGIALINSLPLQVAYYRSTAFDARLKELSAEHDAIFAHLIRTGDRVRDYPGIKFLEMTDAISLNYNRIRSGAKLRFDPRTWIFSVEATRLKKYEQNIVNDFEQTFLVSNTDRDFLFPGDTEKQKKITVCSNGVDITKLPFQFKNECKDIIFIGNLCSLQNLDMATYMSRDILPLVRQKHPSSNLRIIGKISSGNAAQLKAFEGVEVIGQVDDIATAAEFGAVGVCPMRVGAGVQNKILEYMALGLPVVTTTFGLEGLAAKDNQHLLVADSAQTIADQIVTLISDRERAKTIALDARKYVRQNHSWDKILKPLVDNVLATCKYNNLKH